ncbi:heterokaryon incompatibility protein-domain-containing protein [Lasiosphaeris hirsuta]|uniref:Heterokaryon incompatibility protein-domain-containing protein n=1 Tax=Lasiosphaeris hirsuta TaxID=260670 RepID=A0AA40AHY7_9PEZI|nr:heterokaryon incompatibility protein-domain-containing protein [Lasiosphaeris hirsuta]
MAVYTPLNTQNKETRLLLLHAGSSDEPIQCSLQVVSLHHGPQYEALSYVWGSQHSNTSIDLSGQPFRVTPNLHAALKRLRLAGSQRTLWVDAVCINQADNDEKAAQVAMMSDIYTDTSGALLWLGEEPDTPVPTVNPAQSQEVDTLLLQTDKFLADLASALDTWQDTEIGHLAADLHRSIQTPIPGPAPDNFLITRTRPHTWHGDDRDTRALLAAATDPDLTNDSIFHAFALFRLLAADHHLHTIPYLDLDPDPDPDDAQTPPTHARRAAHWLATRPWWSRIWTAQECLLPRASTLLYGPVSMPWDTVLTGLLNFQRHRDTCCAAVPGVRDMLNQPVEAARDLDELRRTRGAVSLARVLPTFRYRGATDSRDKVYALLPLVTEWYGAAPLVPDYTKPVGHVYTEAVLHIARASRSLHVLCRPPEMEEEKRMPGLPSWVMDLSQPAAAGATLDRLAGMLPLNDACGGVGVQGMEVYEDAGGAKVLAMQGVRVDALRRASAIMVGLSDAAMRDTAKWWLEVAREELGMVDGEWEGKFARMMCGDAMVIPEVGQRVAGFRRATEEDCRRVRAWVESLQAPALGDGIDGEGEIGAVSHAVKAATQMRAFIVSREGRMGLVPNMARLTFPRPDEIFLFPGGKTPVVLRDVGVRDIPGIGPTVCHTFLGDCYLHGVMDGEGMGRFAEEKQMIYIV